MVLLIVAVVVLLLVEVVEVWIVQVEGGIILMTVLHII